MRLLHFFLVLGLLLPLQAQAEYRAFVLRIEKVAMPEEYREVVSNLDPRQYIGYHPISNDERIYYTDTWLCPGRTSGFSKFCDKPGTPLLD